MISRRRFLEVGSVTAGLAAAPHSLRAAAAEKDEASLPPSIAQLKSRKSEATPITREERVERQQRARQLMTENGLDAILLMEGTSLRYFTGVRWWGGERTFALVLPAKGAAFYVCPAFEEGRAREQLANAPDGEQADVRVWQEDESPYQRIAQGLKERGIASGKLGIEETVRFVFADGIAKALSQAVPQVTIASATPVTAGCRMIKSVHEVALMRLASQVTLAAYEAVYRALRPGMTQRDASGLIDAAYRQLGFPGEASVMVDQATAFPHGLTTAQVIRERSIVMIDDGCTVEGYQSDITRTFAMGKAVRQDEAGVRHRAARAVGRVGSGASRGRMRFGGCGRPQGHHRCRLRSRLQILHAPARTWPRDGWARVALPGPRKCDQAASEHDYQQRAGNLYSRRVWRADRRRHAHHGEWRGAVHAATLSLEDPFGKAS